MEKIKKMITTAHFNAILAKNNIARKLRDNMKDIIDILPVNSIVEDLKAIEYYTKEANQPSVEDIIASDRTDI